MRNLAIMAALALALASAGCAIDSFTAGRPNYKGQPLSAVVAKLGWPEEKQTIEGQKVYSWREGTGQSQCRIQVAMAGDVIDSYQTSGDAKICSFYE